jgi:ADP-heptose:LPS heptosyltransferase
MAGFAGHMLVAFTRPVDFMFFPSLIKRLRPAFAWRRSSMDRVLLHLRTILPGRLFVLLRWPWPLRKPWQRKRLRVLAAGGGIGDELMCMPVLREIKRLNPDCYITFVSRHPGLFSGSRLADCVVPFEKWVTDHGIYLRYGPTFPPMRPLITLMAECVGLTFKPAAVSLERPSINPDRDLQTRLDAIPGPKIVVQTLTSRWTPNKNWPPSHWDDLVGLLTTNFAVIEVGTESGLGHGDFGPRFHSFVGKTDVSGFAQIISNADVFVGPVSGGMHLAKAFDVPSAIIFGGYESPAGHLYSGMVPFYNPVECAPCWLRDICPYQRRCLTGIPPADVHATICRLIKPSTTAIA